MRNENAHAHAFRSTFRRYGCGALVKCIQITVVWSLKKPSYTNELDTMTERAKYSLVSISL